MNEGRQTTRHDNGNSGFLETSLMTGNKNSKMYFSSVRGFVMLLIFSPSCEVWPLGR